MVEGTSIMTERDFDMQKESGIAGIWQKKPPVRNLILFTIVFIILTGLFHWIVADNWSKSSLETDMVNASGMILADDSDGLLIRQPFTSGMDTLMSIRLMPCRRSSNISGTVRISILEQDGASVLWNKEIDPSDLIFDQVNTIDVQPVVTGTSGKKLLLVIDAGGTGISFQKGSTVSAGKFEIEVASEEEMTVNGTVQEGMLVFSIYGENDLNAYKWILPGSAVLYLLCLLVFFMYARQKKTGKVNLVGKIVDLATRYRYLLKTLVMRDFRVKYQASLLGVLWSFLNPLLTMFVYLFVFSMIFRSNIENFPVYLLSGIVLFNYFSESTNLGLLSIVGNRTLITKVYMPKYIYPLSKVLSSAINLLISLIPLFIVMVLTGMPMHKSILLLPFVVFCQIMFCTGMSLILSTLNVFFRDIQFLWSIIVTIWNFLTPIFYPESIIPPAFIRLYQMNPLYQIVYFMRCITIGGISPAPVTYLYCLLACGVPLLIGIVFFRKNQDRFVLYL